MEDLASCVITPEAEEKRGARTGQMQRISGDEKKGTYQATIEEVLGKLINARQGAEHERRGADVTRAE